MIDEHFVLVGGLVNFFLAFTYVWGTLKGRVKPNRVSWFIWALAPMLATAAELSQGVGWLAFVTFMSGFPGFLIFLASFVNKKAYWKVTRLDLACGALALLGLALWWETSVGNWAIAFALAADLLAGIPTLIKAYRFPETESSITFFGGSFSAFVGLLTISSWSFEAAAFPLYLLVIDIIIILLVRFKLGKYLMRS